MKHTKANIVLFYPNKKMGASGGTMSLTFLGTKPAAADVLAAFVKLDDEKYLTKEHKRRLLDSDFTCHPTVVIDMEKEEC